MQIHSHRCGLPRLLILLTAVLAAAVLPSLAVETRFWTEDTFSEFERGNLSKLSIRSDGRLSLAPVVTELLDSSTPYLWTAARDSKGNLFAGGGGPTGSTAKLFQVDHNGKSKVLAEVEGFEIHAIAVDASDRVYAATAPDGKVYRVVDGKAQVFYDPKAKYIWAMAFSKTGDLYVATGDRGEIHRVRPDGHGAVFFETEESHARSLAFDPAGNLIVGTEPGGLIIRITPAGESFVLYQSPKREITAVAAAADGSIYAAGVGTRSPGAPALPPPGPAPVPVPSPAPGAGPAGATPAHAGAQPRAMPPPTLGAGAPSISGGSDVYRIGPDGAPRKIWSNAQDVVYALMLDPKGRPLVGAGNKGNVYRIDTDLCYTLLVTLPPTQVTAFAGGPNGQIFAVTGNIGKVYRIGPEIEKTGTFESEPFDANAFTYWGRLRYEPQVGGGTVTFEARSGNVDHPRKNWSAWSPVSLTGDSGRIAAPAARFLQFRATLTAGADAGSPEVTGVEVAYMAKNVAPVLSQVEITPANYKFSLASSITVPIGGSSSPQTLNLPAMGAKKAAGNIPPMEGSSGQSMQYSKGSIGARWASQDENGDALIYRVEIRGEKESQWKLLKDKVHDKHLSWDSTAFADGRYLVRVTATDAPGNPPADALTSEIVSDPFLIDNTPPRITGLSAAAAANNKIEVRWRASDALSVIDHAEYSLNGGDWMLVEPVTRLSDALELEYKLLIDRPSGSESTIAVRVTDDFDNQAVDKAVVK